MSLLAAAMSPIPPAVRQRRPREQGIALLMTLAVLSLLIVLAFSFALAAINSQVTSKLDEGIAKARIESENALQRVYRQIGVDFASRQDDRNLFPATSDAGGATSGPIGSAFAGRYYWYSTNPDDQYDIDRALHVTLGGVDFLPAGISDSFPDIGWLPITDPRLGDRLIARYCYVVIDESGKVDPSAAVSATVAEGMETGRLGVSSSEISLIDVLDDTDLARYFQPVALPTGKLPTGLRWLSTYHILNQDTQVRASPELVRRTLSRIFPHSYDIEAFHDSTTDKHRFNLLLSQAEWDSMGIATIDTTASNYWEADGVTVAPNQSGIPWFHFGAAALKAQIIANLIDYCDSDHLPTSDFSLTPVPYASYVGLERVPYVNELLITMHVQPATDTPGHFDWNADLQAELINMYDRDHDLSGASLVASLHVDYAVDDSAAAIDFLYTFTPESPAYTNVVADSRAYYTFDNRSLGAIVPIGTNDTVEIRDLYVNYVTLTDASGAILDFVGQSRALSEFGASQRVSIANNFYSINLEVDDPRHNQPADGWAWADAWVQGFGGTLGARNAFCDVDGAADPDGDGIPNRDYEPNAAEPWDVSTAYIRDAPLESLWELGTIHRSAPWQTLNLKHQDGASSASSGFTSYTAGDASLLDQVKLGDRLREVGRVNINSPSPDVLKGLFAHLPISSHYDPALATDTPVAIEAALAMANDLIAATNTQLGGTPFRQRSQLANVSRLIRQWEGDQANQFHPSDAAMESIAGKLPSLTCVRQNYFTIILVAQVVKDIGAVPILGTEETLVNGVYCQLNRFDPGGDEVIGQQRIMAIIYRDALNGRYRLESFEYLD